MNIRIDLNEPQILQKVTSDRFGLFVSHEWKKLIDPYTPEDTGLLMGKIGMSVEELPFQLHYKATQGSNSTTESSGSNKSYAAYVYFSNGYNFQKPTATDHWDVKAAEAGQLDKLYRTLNNGLRTGQF